MKIPFVGQTYPSRSRNISVERSVNLFPEVNVYGDSRNIAAMIGTPGTELFKFTGANIVRGMHPFNGRLYVVASNQFFYIDDAQQMSASLGTLATSSGRVCIKDNGTASGGIGGDQLIITDGANGYIYDITAATFSTIAGGGWPAAGATQVAYIDGYFVAITSGSMSGICSDLYDGTTWNALAYSPISAFPGEVKAVVNHMQQLWFIKEFSTEVWYNAGTATTTGFPFRRVSGAVLNYGTPAPWSVARGANSIFMVANERTGEHGEFVGIVKFDGYVPTVISPPSINYQIARMTNIADAFGYCYSLEGHTFYVCTFPTGNATFVYDATTGMWHEWSTYTGTPFAISRHYSNTYAYFMGRHLVGDYRSGNIYEMDSDIYTDNGDPIVAMRITQAMQDGQKNANFFVKRLSVELEKGVGDDSAAEDPQASLSWSNDGGHTWSNGYAASMGRIGEHGTSLEWRRLGYAKNRVWRLVIDAPVRKVILGAYVS